MCKNVTLTATKLPVHTYFGGQEWDCIAPIALSVDLNIHFFHEHCFFLWGCSFLWSNSTWEVMESCKQLVSFWWHGIRLALSSISLLGLGWYFSSCPQKQLCWSAVELHPKINSTVHWKDGGGQCMWYQSAKRIPALCSPAYDFPCHAGLDLNFALSSILTKQLQCLLY